MYFYTLYYSIFFICQEFYVLLYFFKQKKEKEINFFLFDNSLIFSFHKFRYAHVDGYHPQSY